MFQVDAIQTIQEYLKEIQNDIQQADYDHKVEQGILQFIKDIVSRKIEIKAHPSRKLHAKIYLFRQQNWNEHN